VALWEGNLFAAKGNFYKPLHLLGPQILAAKAAPTRHLLPPVGAALAANRPIPLLINTRRQPVENVLHDGLPFRFIENFVIEAIIDKQCFVIGADGVVK
jgi:hypothetical protein